MTEAELLARVDELINENARLREALRPCADALYLIEGWSKNYWVIRDDQYFKVMGWDIPISVADCRRAARLLEETK